MQAEDIERIRESCDPQNIIFHERKQQSLITSINSLLRRVTCCTTSRGTRLLEKIEFELKQHLSK